MEQSPKQGIVDQLRARILSMQGIGKTGNGQRIGLGEIETAFPEGIFPTGAIHELVSTGAEAAAATSGFLSCLLHSMMDKQGFCLWVSSRRIVFPPALKLLGIDPENVIFADLQNDKDALWVIEEGLRCSALVAVVGELKELTFMQSRRMQLAVEESKVTGFIHRVMPKNENTTTCVARWKISPLPGIIEPGMPGIGFPKWKVELTKVRNGRPGSWELGWTPGGFKHFSKNTSGTDIKPAQYA